MAAASTRTQRSDRHRGAARHRCAVLARCAAVGLTAGLASAFVVGGPRHAAPPKPATGTAVMPIRYSMAPAWRRSRPQLHDRPEEEKRHQQQQARRRGVASAPGVRRVTVARLAMASGFPDGESDAPLSFRSDNGTRDEEFELGPRKKTSSASQSELTVLPQEEENQYYRIVAALSPKELIGRFARTAPPRVQEAVRQTILGLLGSAGSFAVETNTITTSERLANLMFQLQMTGYMFKNADYRISLSRTLENVPALAPSEIAQDAAQSSQSSSEMRRPASSASSQQDHPSNAVLTAPLPEVRGTLKVAMPGGTHVEVDADAYMTELRDEVQGLKQELERVERDKRETAQRDLLAYVRSMPEQQLAALTSDVTDDVLDGMKKLVYSIMRSMGTANVEPGTVLQQSGAAMAQLCMWQLVIGYNLRELEVRDQLTKQLQLPPE